MVWAAALLIVSYVPAEAAKSELGLIAGGGMAGTIGDVSTHADYGFLGFAGFRFTPDTSPRGDIDLILRAGYSTFEAKLLDRRDIDVVTIGLEGRINNLMRSPANIYLVSGAGFARTTLAAYEDVIRLGGGVYEFRPVAERKESNTYVTAGLGIQTSRKSGLQLFIEGRVTNVFGTELKNLTWFPVTVGILF